jgi:hypothetical protein
MFDFRLVTSAHAVRPPISVILRNDELRIRIERDADDVLICR